MVNNKEQVLVIQEKYHTSKHWKLPGGHADSGKLNKQKINVLDDLVHEVSLTLLSKSHDLGTFKLSVQRLSQLRLT